nr:MAG TPA: hypothetical protein [Caudoviricetes sp.]
MLQNDQLLLQKMCEIKREVNPTTTELNIGVCEGRHEMPCKIFVYGSTIEDPSNITALEQWANVVIATIVHYKQCGNLTINLYVTGLTMATLSIVNAVKRANTSSAVHDYGLLKLELVCKHYNTATASYVDQPIIVM